MMVLRQLLTAIVRDLVPQSAIAFCAVPGDPQDAAKHQWRARPLTKELPATLPLGCNGYATLASFRRDPATRRFNRRAVNYAGGYGFMIDDLGDGPGSKSPMSVIDPLTPTALIETSPGNHQAIYLFAEALRDRLLHRRLIDAFVDERMDGNDNGQKGVTRVIRLPGCINGKPRYRDAAGKPFVVRCVEFDAERRYSLAQIDAAFGLRLLAPELRPATRRGMSKAELSQALFVQSGGVIADGRDMVEFNWELYRLTYASLKSLGLLRGYTDDDGWTPIRCHWAHEHTGGKDDGSYIREPRPGSAALGEGNNNVGAFKCNHGHCAGRGWRQLTDYLDELNAAALDAANGEAKDHE